MFICLLNHGIYGWCTLSPPFCIMTWQSSWSPSPHTKEGCLQVPGHRRELSGSRMRDLGFQVLSQQMSHKSTLVVCLAHSLRETTQKASSRTHGEESPIFLFQLLLLTVRCLHSLLVYFACLLTGLLLLGFPICTIFLKAEIFSCHSSAL